MQKRLLPKNAIVENVGQVIRCDRFNRTYTCICRVRRNGLPYLKLSLTRIIRPIGLERFISLGFGRSIRFSSRHRARWPGGEQRGFVIVFKNAERVTATQRAFRTRGSV